METEFTLAAMPTDPRFIDRTGTRYGRLVVVGYLGRPEGSVMRWLCKCDCGKLSRPTPANLTSGHTTSCGCYQQERRHDSYPRHGLSKRRVWSSWNHMKCRCLDPKHKFYSLYGGRGISICQRWLDSFDNFLADMGEPPTEQHTLDRIDPNGNYEPTNCRWATRKEQIKNRRPRSEWRRSDEAVR